MESFKYEFLDGIKIIKPLYYVDYDKKKQKLLLVRNMVGRIMVDIIMSQSLLAS